MQAIKIDYFDATGDNQDAETNGKLYARNCIFDLTVHEIPVLRAIEILRADVNNANWVGNIKSNFYFGTGFLNELYLIEQQIKEDEESQLIEAFRAKLKRCYAKKAVTHPQDASFIATHSDVTVPPRFRNEG
jgi:hypothetical protein